ncbi:adipocyte enhancer-binding protein 1-like, partial [Ylistrum balloti]
MACCIGILLLVFSLHVISNGQPLLPGDRAEVEAALMEQRIMANIRLLLPDLYAGDCRKHNREQTTVIRALRKRVEDLEDYTTGKNVTVCSDYLVSGLYGVDSTALTASSKWANPGLDHGPENSRLNHERFTNSTRSMTGSWSSAKNNDQQYIQVRFPRKTEVKAILLRGRNERISQWVKTYHLLYSEDGVNWATVLSNNQEPKLFIGNTDRNTIVKSYVVPSITAVYLRINPRSWNNHVSLRFDASGCYTVRATPNRIHMALGFRPLLSWMSPLYRVNERSLTQVDAANLCAQQFSQLIKVDSGAVMTSLQAVVEGNHIL